MASSESGLLSQFESDLICLIKYLTWWITTSPISYNTFPFPYFHFKGFAICPIIGTNSNPDLTGTFHFAVCETNAELPPQHGGSCPLPFGNLALQESAHHGWHLQLHCTATNPQIQKQIL